MIWRKFRASVIVGYRRAIALIVLGVLGVAIAGWFLPVSRLFANASHPVDAYFVLGGSIRREIYVAQLAARSPQIPILISSGSKDPCIWLIFRREQAPMERVWLEGCAKTTFGNFYFGIPILRQWGVHKVKLITSPTHLPRAQWLAQVGFGAQGIWVEIDLAREKGVPGNSETWVKTTLDVTRSLLWAIGSRFIQPRCERILRLVEVDLEMWRKRGFKCEHQANLVTDEF